MPPLAYDLIIFLATVHHLRLRQSKLTGNQLPFLKHFQGFCRVPGSVLAGQIQAVLKTLQKLRQKAIGCLLQGQILTGNGIELRIKVAGWPAADFKARNK
ncbi:MAG: hypothetical protein D5S03_09780 [Desulfonatronospira sp. MSAO_Bac3]|nr:MAG: hypothetical protein D5S03_09780 [Desulfonatronospira sp. MSAO_Bac3]